MEGSILGIISGAVLAARAEGLKGGEELVAACAVLLARDPTLSPGTARVLVERLFPMLEADRTGSVQAAAGK